MDIIKKESHYDNGNDLVNTEYENNSITDFMGKNDSGKWFVKDWDKVADTIIAKNRLAIYNDTVTIQFTDGQWKTIEEKEKAIIKRYITQLKLNLTPTLISQIADHTVAMISQIKVKTDDNVIYFSNGDFDIKTGKFTYIEKPTYNHRRLNRAYVPMMQAKAAGQVMKFLAQFQQYDEHMIARQIAEMVGAILVPTGVFRKMFQLYGNGFNGKSEVMNITAAAIGKDKVATVDLEALTGGRAFAMVPLVNKTMNLVDELETVKGNGIAKLKIAASGGTMSAEIKGGRAFSFTNEATVVFGANFNLDATDGSNSIGDRLQIIHFIKRFKDKNGNRTVDLMTRDEYMNDDFYEAWLALGAQAAHKLYLNNKEFTTDVHSQELEDERQRQACSVFEWLEEGSRELFNHDGIYKDEAYFKYKQWCERNGRHPVNGIKFGQRLNNHIYNLDTKSRKIDKITRERRYIYRVKEDFENE